MSEFKVALLAMTLWPKVMLADAVITLQPTNVAVTVPQSIIASPLTEESLLGKSFRLEITTGTFPHLSQGSYFISLSATEHTYDISSGTTSVTTTGPWEYVVGANGAAIVRLYHWEDGGRQIFFGDAVLRPDGRYQFLQLDADNHLRPTQVGTYTVFDAVTTASRASAVFSVAATGTEPISYQWYRNGQPLEDGLHSAGLFYLGGLLPPGQTLINGARAATLSISNVTRFDAGRYYCVLSNVNGTLPSAGATLTVNGYAAPDLTRPVLKITSPTANAFRVTANPVFVTGTCADDDDVGLVFLQKNSEPFVAINSDGTTWGINQTLDPGTNVIRVYALDRSGNTSFTNSKTLFYAAPVPFDLIINGAGRVVPLTSGQPIVVGKRYLIRAVAEPGNLFSHWLGSIASTNPAVSFVATPNKTFIANFVTNPFVALKGVYTGLFMDTHNPSHENAGYLRLSLTDRGSFSGRLTLADGAVPVSGQFGLDLRAHRTIVRRGNHPPTELHLQLAADSDQLSGLVTNGAVASQLIARRAAFSRTQPATQWRGHYTALFPGRNDPMGPAPFGDSFATLSVNSAGDYLIKPKLADGTAFVQAGPIAAEGEIPIYSQIYGGRGSLFGWLTLGDTNVTAQLLWTKPSGVPGRFYPSGFVQPLLCVGSRYSVSVPPIGVVPFTNVFVVLQGGNLPDTLTTNATITLTNNRRVTSVNTPFLTLSFDVPSDTFTGSFTNPGTLNPSVVKGVFLQSQNFGGGFFLGTNQSGRVFLRP